MTTTSIETVDREDCPLCKKFGSGPCGKVFQQWLSCTDANPGKDESGEPLHLTKCAIFAEKLAVCIDTNAEYYANDENDGSTEDVDATNNSELKYAWSDFVREMEDGIKGHQYKLQSFPEKLQPTIHVKLSSKMGASYFKHQMENGASIISAYILDDRGNVLAAGAKDDMDMGSRFGCVLRFEVSDRMQSATCRAIYDEESGSDVTVYSKTFLVPKR